MACRAHLTSSLAAVASASCDRNAVLQVGRMIAQQEEKHQPQQEPAGGSAGTKASRKSRDSSRTAGTSTTQPSSSTQSAVSLEKEAAEGGAAQGSRERIRSTLHHA